MTVPWLSLVIPVFSASPPRYRNARRLLGRDPGTSMAESIATTLDYFLRDYVATFGQTGGNKTPGRTTATGTSRQP